MRDALRSDNERHRAQGALLQQQHGQFVWGCRNSAGFRLLQLLAPAEAPQHANAAHVVGNGAFDIEASIPNHHRIGGLAIEIGQGRAAHGGLFAVRTVGAWAIQPQKGIAERQLGNDWRSVLIWLAGYHGKLVAGREQLFNQDLDTGIDHMFAPTAGVETLVVVTDGCFDSFGIIVQQRRKTLTQWWSDPLAQWFIRRRWNIQFCQRIFHAHRDAMFGVDQRSVEVEQTQHYSEARALSAVTAGSSLPSRNSRKAPPPVEM